jgi:hypothetical protein
LRRSLPFVTRLFAALFALAGSTAIAAAQLQLQAPNPRKACMVELGLTGGAATTTKPANPRYCNVSSAAALGSECSCPEWGRGTVVVSPDYAK